MNEPSQYHTKRAHACVSDETGKKLTADGVDSEMMTMAFVYFSDADNGVHQVPSALTHFQPNEPGAPYVVAELKVAYASGAVIDYRVTAEYFAMFLGFVDETSPTFSYRNVVTGLQMGAFVRFIGSQKAVPVIVNYMLATKSMDMVLMHAIEMDDAPHKNADLRFVYSPRSFSIHDESNDHCTLEDYDIPSRYARVIMRIVDECEHVREVIDYIRTSTNDTYVDRLYDYDDRIESILDQLNPIEHLFAMKWLAKDFRNIPQSVIDDWVDSVSMDV